MDSEHELTRAAQDGDVASVARLLSAGAEADAPDARRRTALEVAVDAGQVEIVRLLLAAGADPRRPTGEYDELTPLLQAAMRPEAEIVLLGRGAAPTEYALSIAHHPARRSPEDEERYLPVLHALHAARRQG
ncbi:ankyrin repeat domain-containing protein [Streptomyces sp. JL2001]|uniref:ankyrin repeat domain-containing protein n=1 Tax=Streptomyces sp. JL2001 TaxID=3342488 RepID=UPI003D80376B